MELFIKKRKKKLYFIKILQKINFYKKKGKIIYPNSKDIFNIFRLIEFKKIKIVILGQDPYFKINQAHGLAFSVLPNIRIPPSLINIFKAISYDIKNFKFPNHGYLISWVKQGVFLLNTILTVEAGKPNSHKKLGWEIFTDKIITLINFYGDKIVFLLWGTNAQKKINLINKKKHLVLCAPHPSPLSAHRGFFNCHHFSQANKYLIKNNKIPINWEI